MNEILAAQRCTSVEQIVQCRKLSSNRIIICACANILRMSDRAGSTDRVPTASMHCDCGPGCIDAVTDHNRLLPNDVTCLFSGHRFFCFCLLSFVCGVQTPLHSGSVFFKSRFNKKGSSYRTAWHCWWKPCVAIYILILRRWRMVRAARYDLKSKSRLIAHFTSITINER